MRVRGDNAPSNAFSLEEQPNKPGVALVRFYENAEPFEEKRDELTISGWVYDEYHLELNMYDGLSEDILGNYAGYLAQAKLHEAEGKTIPSLQQQVADLETDKAALTEKVTSLEGQVTDTQMALCDVYEQIVAVTSTTGGEEPMASNYMVKVYADLIRKGKKTIEEVPDHLQAAVREILENSKNGAEGL